MLPLEVAVFVEFDAGTTPFVNEPARGSSPDPFPAPPHAVKRARAQMPAKARFMGESSECADVQASLFTVSLPYVS